MIWGTPIWGNPYMCTGGIIHVEALLTWCLAQLKNVLHAGRINLHMVCHVDMVKFFRRLCTKICSLRLELSSRKWISWYTHDIQGMANSLQCSASCLVEQGQDNFFAGSERQKVLWKNLSQCHQKEGCLRHIWSNKSKEPIQDPFYMILRQWKHIKIT